MNFLAGCPVDISRRNRQDDFELLQRVGSGTYGDVFQGIDCLNVFLLCTHLTAFCIHNVY